jgi:hypothetical protein
MKKPASLDCKKLEDNELLARTLLTAQVERRVTLKLLNYLVEVDARRLYATVNARSSLFEYLISDLGLSNAAASDRVNTVRLMRAIPQVKEHLESGKLSVTTAAQIQRFASHEQRANPKGKAIPMEVKKEVVEACLGQSKREVEKTLLGRQSEPAKTLMQEKVKLVSPTRSELRFSVDEKTLAKIQQIKDLIGNRSLEAILNSALDALLLSEQKKRGVPPLQMKSKKSPNAGRPADRNQQAARTETQLNSRFIPIDLKRFTFARSKGQCEHVDPRTHVRCKSRFRLQIDHRRPLALGGKTEESNLRHLCSSHNLRMGMEAGLKRPQYPSPQMHS